MKKMSNYELAYVTLKKMIAERKILPGQQIVESAFAKSLGISRTPVRETLKRLEEEGLIDSIPNKGSYVKIISYADLADSYEVIEGIMALTYKLLAEHVQCGKLEVGELSELKKIAQALFDLYSAGSIVSWIQADIEFHQKMVSLTGNAHLTKTYENMKSSINQVLWHITPNVVDIGLSAEEHFEIIQVIEQGDVQKSILIGHRHNGRIVGQIRELQERF